jgi:DNA-binding CsgD family transcriptional regulator
MLDINDREDEVLRRLVTGQSRKEIAIALNIQVVTVHARLYAARDRTGTRSIEHLIAAYVADALTKSEPE